MSPIAKRKTEKVDAEARDLSKGTVSFRAKSAKGAKVWK
jgi:hypothetical protein